MRPTKLILLVLLAFFASHRAVAQELFPVHGGNRDDSLALAYASISDPAEDGPPSREGNGGEDVPDPKHADYTQAAMTRPGDAERGRAIFLDPHRTKCQTCHKVNGEGGEVGPDLSRIGGKFDRPHLIESLLEPSRQIVEGFRASTIVTVDGQTVSGILTNPTDHSLMLVDAENHRREFIRDQLESITPSAISLMPLGIADQLSENEFTDLIAYLETLRTGEAKFGGGVSGPVSLPPGFGIELLATGLTGTTALETLPDGRILICEQIGRLRVFQDGVLLEEPMLVLDVDSSWERGLIGVTVHPQFPREPYLYACYVANDPYPHHRISRFRISGNRVVDHGEEILLRGDDQRKLGGNVPAGHQGGSLHFGGDGKLYVGIGEQTAETPAQRIDTFQGKILRLNPDGSIPTDNPFFATASGKYRAIWAIGCRNPFTFAFHPVTGQMLINDVGGKFEEINPGIAGANYGWPAADHGPVDDAKFVGPVHIYPQASISGGAFAPPNLDWGSRFADRYFFADFVHGWVKTIDPADPAIAHDFASGLRRPVDIRFATDGSLYVLLRNAWVIDDKFEGETGSLLRIRKVGAAVPNDLTRGRGE